MESILIYVLFAVGIVLIVKGGDWFVDGAVWAAEITRIPKFIIGATIISVATTLPEIFVSTIAAMEGHGILVSQVGDYIAASQDKVGMAIGNGIGSVICNTALIAALTIAIRPSEADRKSLRTPVIFFFVAAVFYAAIAYTNGAFTRLAGIVLLAMFVLYMVLTVRQSFRDTVRAGGADEAIDGTPSMGKDILLLVVGAAFIAVGANLLVNNGTLIAQGLGVPESVIALTFVALGTSLPELVTAITSLVKGHSALSLGNIVGANLFNLVLVSGLSTTLSPFQVPQEKTIAGYNASLVVDIPLMLLVMLLLTVPALARGKLSRWQGIVLLVLYAGFCAFQFCM